MVKYLPANAGYVRLIPGSGEDPLEEEATTHSNTHAWQIQWTQEPGGLQSIALQRVRYG